MAFTGGCLCGRVRYTVEGQPNFAAVCHCRSCQRYTGSAFEPVMVFPSQAVEVHGDLKTYDDVGDSENSCIAASARTVVQASSPMSMRCPESRSFWLVRSMNLLSSSQAWKSSVPAHSPGCSNHRTSGRSLIKCRGKSLPNIGSWPGEGTRLPRRALRCPTNSPPPFRPAACWSGCSWFSRSGLSQRWRP